MDWPKLNIDRRIQLGLAVLAALTLGFLLSFWSLRQYVRDRQTSAQARYLFEHLDSMSMLSLEAEAAVRGYVLTGKSTQLIPYKNASYLLDQELQRVAWVLRADPAQKENLEKLRAILSQKLISLKRIVDARKSKGAEGARAVFEAEEGQALFKKIRLLIVQIKDTRGRTTASKYSEDEREAGSSVLRGFVIQNLVALFVTLLVMLILFRTVSARHRAEEKFKEVSRKLQIWVDDLAERNREFTILSETVDTLQTCVTMEEACRVISHSCQKLFPGMQGALYLINESKSLVELATDWNGPLQGEAVFEFDDCWALRRGRIYEVEKNSDHATCAHVSGVPFDVYLCIPMMGQGAALGFFHFRQTTKPDAAPDAGHGKNFPETKRSLVIAFAEQAALALANLRLRETLHYQSMRDPLTGLFNRRHMEEVLDRELRRATRSSRPLGILMLDVDHFKKFNDTYGHDVGDELLLELSQHIRRGIRDYDIPCRYGGEEFIVLLPEASLEAAQKRAEQLRKSAKHLQIQRNGKLLDPVSLSIGVAVFPMHGETAESLLRAADNALYEAKSQGRDRVVVAEAV